MAIIVPRDRPHPLEAGLVNMAAKLDQEAEIARGKADEEEARQQEKRDYVARQTFSNMSQLIMKQVPREKQAEGYRTLTQWYLNMSSDPRPEREVLNTDVAMLTGKRVIGADRKNQVVDSGANKKRRERRIAGESAAASLSRPGEGPLDDVFGLMNPVKKDLTGVDEYKYRAMLKDLGQAKAAVREAIAQGEWGGGSEAVKKLEDKVRFLQAGVDDFTRQFGGFMGSRGKGTPGQTTAVPAAVAAIGGKGRAKKKPPRSVGLDSIVRIRPSGLWKEDGVLEMQKGGSWVRMEEADYGRALRVAAFEMADPEDKSDVEKVVLSGQVGVMKRLLMEILRDKQKE